MSPDDARPGPGHNTPPGERDLLKDRLEELLRNADRWVTERQVIETDEVAGRAGAAVEQIRALEKDLANAKDREKRPHLDANVAIEDYYKPLVRRAAAAKEAILDIVGAFLRKKRERERAEAERLRLEAETRRREADRIARQAAESGKVSDKIRADEAAERATNTAAVATKAAKTAEAPKVRGDLQSRATSMRKVREGTITDWPTALDNYSNRREVRELVERLIAADIRGGATVIPGVNITEDERAQ